MSEMIQKMKSFELPSDAIYTKGLSNSTDFRQEIAKEKGMGDGSFKGFYKSLSTTLNTFAAGTIGVLVPVYVDPEIIDETRRDTPLVELIPRVKNMGSYAAYNVITTISTAQALNENASIAVQDDTVARRTVLMKYLYSSGQVTGPMLVASQPYMASAGYVDALAYEVKNKTIAGKRLEEAMLLVGDSKNTWTEPVNSTVMPANTSFDGLWNIISDSNSIGLGGSSSYYTDLSATVNTAISISAIRKGIRDARIRGGMPNLIVVDYSTYDDIKALVQDQLRYQSTMTIAWGITTISFEGLPIIPSRFLSTTAATTSGKTPLNAKSMFILDLSVIENRVLLDWSYEEAAKTNDSLKFWLKCYEALVVRAPKFNQILVGLA